jgi:hypothetical protein
MPKQPDDDLIAPRVLSRYRQIGVIPGWSDERLVKLCHLANRLPEEIGAMAGLTPIQTRRFLEAKRFPPSVSLHFAVIDAVFRERNFGEPFEPLIPLDWLERK